MFQCRNLYFAGIAWFGLKCFFRPLHFLIFFQAFLVVFVVFSRVFFHVYCQFLSITVFTVIFSPVLSRTSVSFVEVTSFETFNSTGVVVRKLQSFSISQFLFQCRSCSSFGFCFGPEELTTAVINVFYRCKKFFDDLNQG